MKKEKTSRICKTAVGRIMLKLLERAESENWCAESLGDTMRAVGQYMNGDSYNEEGRADGDAYRELCAEIDRSEERSRKARERWRSKHSENVQETVETQSEKTEVSSTAEPATTVATPQAEPHPVLPALTPWDKIVPILKDKIDLPENRPVYPQEVPEELRAYGIVSFQEYATLRGIENGLSGEELESNVFDRTYAMAVKRYGKARYY